MQKLILLVMTQIVAFIASGQYSIKGTVTGKGEPMTGASVVIEDSYIGTSTGLKGDFEFRNLKPGPLTLKISYIGYETKEVRLNLLSNQEIKIDLEVKELLTEEILVTATRAQEKTPVAYANVSYEKIEERNLGQDIPYLLSLTPSFVATSDAGTGIGYTNFRIRGTDMNRINVTINGIPLNDPESHGTWFVDFPDLASSIENVQVQRGVGSSTNGAAAFGATINLQTNNLRKDAYAAYKTAFGSYNTFKNTVTAGTGLINKKFSFDARLSKISSDGFIDRATSDLKSFFLSAGYYSENTIFKANIFSGYEKTYQAWWGVPSVRLYNDTEGMKQYEDHWLYTPEQTHEMIMSDSRKYNYYTYQNQVDNYQQDHYHLHFSHKFNTRFSMNSSLFYIYGRGYYENFKNDQDFADYRMPYPIINGEKIEKTDLINRKWLDNDFYGAVYSLNYHNGVSDFAVGGGWNFYDGRHFGKVIWAEYFGNADINHEWYSGTGVKKDASFFLKYNLSVMNSLNLYADAQLRLIDHTIEGIDDELRDISQKHKFDFFNPKFGAFYQLSSFQQVYCSFAIAHREPNRSNYVDADPAGKQPVAETLRDFEAGYSIRNKNFTSNLNFYLMSYKNQLILTGEINDVGAPIMVNVDKSYRTGLELQTALKIASKLHWDFNLTFSRNKIIDFTEFVDNWDTGKQEKISLGKTDLAFSPNLTANSQVNFSPANNLSIKLVSFFTGKQFIDNTSSKERILNSWFTSNLETEYTLRNKLFSEIKVRLNVINLFNEKYESNAWVYSYIYNGKRCKMDGYFPQAGVHYLFSVDFEF